VAIGWRSAGSFARPALRDLAVAARVEEACLFVGKKFAGLVLNP
jgi:hypothetical protein